MVRSIPLISTINITSQPKFLPHERYQRTCQSKCTYTIIHFLFIENILYIVKSIFKFREYKILYSLTMLSILTFYFSFIKKYLLISRYILFTIFFYVLITSQFKDLFGMVFEKLKGNFKIQK